VLHRVFSTLFWGFVVVTSVLLFPVAVLVWAVTAPFDRRRRALHLFTCFWASLYTWLNPLWSVEVRGRDRIPRGQTCVLVANHLSLLDILLMFRLFTHFTWVSKVENFRVPFIGWNMRLNGYIPLKRGDRESVRAMLAACERELRDGTSVMMFPEGTRSRSGALQPFKPGAFDLALRTGSPLLPVLVEGTASALPKRGFVLRGRHRIRLTVLDPIPVESFAGLDVATLTERTHALFAEKLAARAPEGTPP
jgi:1-acyl-sn-glycerol-3-phosphate acyltransferase